jgi:hypothetical protein
MTAKRSSGARAADDTAATASAASTAAREWLDAHHADVLAAVEKLARESFAAHPPQAPAAKPGRPRRG